MPEVYFQFEEDGIQLWIWLESSTLQPSLIESTNVIVCFSTSTSSTFSLGGDCTIRSLGIS